MKFIFDPSLVLYLPLYKLDGASFMSRDAYGHLCTVTGAIWTPQGHSFDGTDDEIALPSAVYQAFSNSDDFTICIWFYVDGTISGATRYAIGFVGDTVAGNPTIGIFQSTSTEKIGAFLRQTADNTGNLVTSGSAAATGWHFVVMKHDASDNNRVYLDLDGVAEGSDNANSLTFATSDFYEGHIGALGPDGAAGDLFWRDRIGEVWVYNRLLTPLELLHNYLATKWRYR